MLDVGALAARLGAPFAPLLAGPVLNPLLAAGRAAWDEVRAAVGEWLADR